MSKTFILGSNGYIGSSVARFLADDGREVVRMGRTDCDVPVDLSDFDSSSCATVESDDFVIVAAAISSPDICEGDYSRCRQINVDGTGKFVEGCLDKGANVLFLSSDAVYASGAGIVYDEDSPVAPQFAYGRMKAAIERRFLRSPQFKAMRLSYVFSPHDKFASYLIDCAKEGSQAEIFHPYYRSCISLLDVLRATRWLGDNWDALPSSVLNLAGSELISRVRYADELIEAMDLPLSYRVTRPGDGFYDARPSATRMGSKYLYNLGIVPQGSFREKLNEILEVS